MTRRGGTIGPAYFDGLYASDPDPWRFATSAYEREKYDATIDALAGRRYTHALEVGCSIGILSHRLADQCARLLCIDAAAAALNQARRHCADRAHVAFACCFVPGDWPPGRFELILLSEVVYYLDTDDIARLAARVRDATQDDADIVLVHWLGATDYPMGGDEAVELFIRQAADYARIVRQARTSEYRLDVLRVKPDRAHGGR